ncbi:hypothetical protein [Chryseobacterium gambrini]|uniref:hypothetical protein n=1 Tax=Chryseobacterium gambrini TaxID=373672 RepID=UPI0022F3FF25|nr:hypothetical protein [Chryseobacterium gambrini]WBX98254.1 hypothetical protein PE065_03120 [Chryseobacterium gambrini]
MKAAKPVEKDNKNHHSQSKKQKAKKPVVVPLPVVEVAPLQTQKPEESAALAGFATPNINKTNASGIIAPVHGSQTIYDQGSEIAYGRFQESMTETGDINHPQTKKAEKNYTSTLNISQVKDYHDLKSGTYVPKTLEEQADNNKTKSRETVPKFILQAGSDDKKKKNKGVGQERSNEKVESHLIKIKPNQHYEGKLISSDEQLDRFAENQMKLTRKLNWGKLGDDFIQKLVKTGGTINYSISLKNEVVAQEIADLPEEKKSFLQNADNKLQSLVLLDLLKELSPAEVADFKSKTTAESSNSKDIENSLRKYIKDRNLRKKENDKRESITNSLTGNSMIDVYHKYKAYQKSQKVVDDWHKNPKHERAVPDNLSENAHSDFSIFEQAAKAMGYTTTEFIKLINQYEIAFRKETVHIAEDGLQKYRHTLFEQKKKLLDDAFLTNLLAKIKASKAKESYKEASRASAGASGMAFAERPTDKDRSFGQEMKALAISKKTEGNNAIGSLSPTTPLVQDNGFNKEGLANVETKQELLNFLSNYINNQEANITRIIQNLHADQGLSIYGYASLLEKSKEQQGIAKDSIFDLIIADKESEESTRQIIEGLLIGVLAVALGLLSFGTGTVAVLLAAGNFALSAYLTYEEIEAYRTQLAAYKVNISKDEPSAVWIIISVVGSALDAAAVAKISSKLVKAGRVFEESKSINQTRKILTEADLDPATQEKVIKSLEEENRAAKVDNYKTKRKVERVEKYEEIKAKKREAKIVKAGSFVTKEIRSKLKTNPNDAFFWSGRTKGIGGQDIALEIAESKGGTTLEGLIDKNKIKMPSWDPDDLNAIKAWEDVSDAYADQVSGEVRAVVGKDLRPGNIWENIELPRLKSKMDVTKITIIDPVTREETVIFERITKTKKLLAEGDLDPATQEKVIKSLEEENRAAKVDNYKTKRKVERVEKYEEIKAKKREAKIVKAGSFVTKEIRSKLKTNPNDAFFWSGRTKGIGGQDIALEIAESKGGTTLEGLIDKNKIKMPSWDPDDLNAIKAWEDVSDAYADQVSGEVRAVVGKDLRPGNIWENIELPRLKSKMDVTKITIIDPVTREETVIFERITKTKKLLAEGDLDPATQEKVIKSLEEENRAAKVDNYKTKRKVERVEKYEEIKAKKREAKIVKAGSFVTKEIRSKLKTNPNDAFFWSGRTKGIGGQDIALEIAESKGGTTLEGLIDKNKIKMPSWDPDDLNAIKAWEDVSDAYADQVSGEVRAVVGKDLRPGNIWENIELPRLKSKMDVTKITIIDPVTREETVIFERIKK